MDPAASIRVQTSQHTRARVRLTPHPAMEELTVITFAADDGESAVELAMSPENLAMLGEHITARLEALGIGLTLLDGEATA